MLTKQEKEYLLKLVESKKESLEKAILNNTNECSSCIKLEFEKLEKIIKKLL